MLKAGKFESREKPGKTISRLCRITLSCLSGCGFNGEKLKPGNGEAGKTHFPASNFPALYPVVERIQGLKIKAGKFTPLKGEMKVSHLSSPHPFLGVKV